MTLGHVGIHEITCRNYIIIFNMDEVLFSSWEDTRSKGYSYQWIFIAFYHCVLCGMFYINNFSCTYWTALNSVICVYLYIFFVNMNYTKENSSQRLFLIDIMFVFSKINYAWNGFCVEIVHEDWCLLYQNKSSQWLPNTPFASIRECLVS